MFKKYLLKVILIALILELTIFNINSYRLLFSKYEKKEYLINDCELKNVEYKEETNSYELLEDTAYILINKTDCRIGTVFFDATILPDLNVDLPIKYEIIYTDETSKNFRELPPKYLLNSINASKYTTCYLSGKSEKIGIKITATKGMNIKINSIRINSIIPFKFNILRVLLIVVIFALIYSLKHSKVFNQTFEENKSTALKIMITTILFFIILNTIIAKNTILEYPDFYCNDFTKSIISGSFHLKQEPNKQLLELENPYDTTQRVRSRDGWDIALFNGKFYVYFGILPELILFVPYMLIEHTFLPSGVGVLIFSILTIIALGMLLLEILKKWFIKVPFKLWFYSEVILLSGSIVFNLIGRPELYEVVTAASLCFSIYGILFAFKFFVNNSQKYIDLIVACVFLALSVACRPTSLLISLIIVPPIIKQCVKNIKEKKHIINLIICVAIPYLTVGILLMIYNYIRFKNIFEFGAKYQLTVNDMTNLKYRLMTIPVGLYTAFFKIPHFTSEFPFIKRDGTTIPFFGFFYTEDNIGGLFALVPTTIAIFTAKKTKFKNKEIKYMVYSFIIVGILISVISIIKAGVLQRYLADYAWLLIIAGLVILLTKYENYKHVETQKIMITIIGICVIFTFLVNIFSGGIVGEKEYMRIYSPKTYYTIRYTMCFWE